MQMPVYVTEVVCLVGIQSDNCPRAETFLNHCTLVSSSNIFNVKFKVKVLVDEV